jgi:hypothetical protein
VDRVFERSRLASLSLALAWATPKVAAAAATAFMTSARDSLRFARFGVGRADVAHDGVAGGFARRIRFVSPKQSHNLAQLVCSVAALVFKQLDDPRAQPPRDASHKISHLLTAKPKFAFKVDVAPPIDGVSSKHHPRAVATFGEQRLFDRRARLRKKRERPRAVEGVLCV